MRPTRDLPTVLPLTAMLLAAVLLPAAGCRPTGRPDDPADVVYAASLTAAMEKSIGPGFQDRTGRGFRGVARGSTAGAHQIRDGILQADAYVTADPGTLEGLGRADPGWAVAFATGRLALGYRSGGRYSAALDSAARGLVRWWKVLERPGFRFGRTDPALDPKGYRTVWMLRLAERHYGIPGLADRLLGGPRQIFPEDQLAARVQTGELDAGVFYLSEARAQGLSAIRLSPAIDFGDPACDSLYRSMSYRAPDGTVHRGGAILYAATVPGGAGDPGVGRAFIAYLLSRRGREALEARGYGPIRAVIGDSAKVPSKLLGLAEAGGATVGDDSLGARTSTCPADR